MSHGLAQQALETGGMVASPYIRVNRSDSLLLTTTFQRLDLNGTSTRNANLFPTMPGMSGKVVEWDSTNKVFRFNTDSLHHYDLIFNYRITSGGLINALNLNVATVKLRFVVPSPTPRYFPFPDDGEYTDIDRTNLTSELRGTFNYILRGAADVRQYGIGIELAVSNTSLIPGSITLSSLDVSMYGR